jgi:hypothetical protein
MDLVTIHSIDGQAVLVVIDGPKRHEFKLRPANVAGILTGLATHITRIGGDNRPRSPLVQNLQDHPRPQDAERGGDG